MRRKVQGTVKWVGTTEAAALLRQFGVRAHVVDFKGLGARSAPLSFTPYDASALISP